MVCGDVMFNNTHTHTHMLTHYTAILLLGVVLPAASVGAEEAEGGWSSVCGNSETA